jgi:hypothetical protein
VWLASRPWGVQQLGCALCMVGARCLLAAKAASAVGHEQLQQRQQAGSAVCERAVHMLDGDVGMGTGGRRGSVRATGQFSGCDRGPCAGAGLVGNYDGRLLVCPCRAGIFFTGVGACQGMEQAQSELMAADLLCSAQRVMLGSR